MNNTVELDKAFYEVLETEDELGAVIRAHIHIEASIREYIALVVTAPDHLPKLPYSQTIRLACALGLDGNYLKALQIVGEIRNQFGHRLNMEISVEQTKKLYESLPLDGKGQIQSIFDDLKRQGFDGMSPFLELPARGQFDLIAMLLKSIVIDSVHLARKQ